MRAFTGVLLSAVLASNAIGVDAAYATRSIKLAACDGSGMTNGNDTSQFVAHNFDWVMATYFPTNQMVADMKTANPNLKVFGYRDVTVTNQTNFPSDMYFYDPDPGPHDKIGFPGTPPTVFLDANSADWRNSVVGLINNFIAEGMDGVLLDDVWADPTGHPPLPDQIDSMGNGIPYTETPSWWNAAYWNPTYENFLSYVRSNVTAPQLIMYNGIDNTGGNEIPSYGGGIYLGDATHYYSDGFSMEGFATSDAFGAYVADPWRALDSTWLDMMNAMINNSANPNAKIVVTLSYGTPDQSYPANPPVHSDSFTSQDLRMYALASYLLGSSPISYFAYQPDCAHISYYPEWNVNYGTPQNAAYYNTTYNVYWRSFSNAEVLVNPSSTTASNPIPVSVPVYRVFPYGGNMPVVPTNLSGDSGLGNGQIELQPISPGSSVTVPPKSAVIVIYNTQL